MHVIRIERTTYALHTNNKTAFMVFRNRNHAHTTESAIRQFIGKHRTLPPPSGGNLVALSSPSDWTHLLYELKTEEISSHELHGMCELCNAGYVHVEDMKVPELTDNRFILSYSGNMYDGVEINAEDMARYLETLL